VKRGGEIKRRPMRSRPRATGPAAEVVDLVLERAQYSCELDGAQIGDRRGVDYHVHHRRPRRMGGSQLPDTNAPQNLLVLCPDDHEMVESERTAAYAGGWLVRQGDDPLLVSVLVLAKPVHLTADGRYERCPEVCATCGDSLPPIGGAS
jgi:5-methylcytosine-specific restriction enzyme A